MANPEIIAEIGVTHGGRLDAALRLVDSAVAAEADVVKFQTFDPDKLFRNDDAEKALLQKLALDRYSFKVIAQHCKQVGIEFMSTPGDVDSLRFLVEELGMRRIKIGSDDLTYAPLVEAAYATGLPVILSTGMATLDEIGIARGHVMDERRLRTTILHCVSLYPCRPEEANLSAISTLIDVFGHSIIGYSDHCEGYDACIAAVALGADVIEKHFCPWGYGGIDAEVSLSPDAFISMVRSLRRVWQMRGTGEKVPGEREAKMIPLLRKGADGKRGVAP